MPMYTCLCMTCGFPEIIVRRVDDRDKDLPSCKVCAGEMRRMVEAPAVQADIGGYTSPIDGRWIEGRVARHEDMRRNNCRPWEGMESEKKAAIARAKDADATFEKGVEKAVYDVYNNMSVEKQKAISQG